MSIYSSRLRRLAEFRALLVIATTSRGTIVRFGHEPQDEDKKIKRLADPAGLVRIGIGRDAAEVSFCNLYGATGYDKPEVSITAEAEMPAATTQAVLRRA